MPESSEAFGPPLSANPQALWTTFLETVERYPDNLAIASVHQQHDLFGIPSLPLDEDGYRQRPYLRWSYKSLAQGVRRLTAGLRAAGIGPGTPIFSFQPNGAEYLLSLWSAAEMDCVFVPVSPRNLANRSEVVHMVKIALMAAPSRDPVVIAASPDAATVIDSLDLWTESTKIIQSPSDHVGDWVAFDRFMPADTMNEKHAAQQLEEVAAGAVLFTSGTTSMPKGIFAQQSTHAWFVESWARSRPPDGVFAGSKFCCVIPNNHSFAHYMVLCAQSVGAAIVYPGPAFEAAGMLDTLYREKVTQVRLAVPPSSYGVFTVIVPTMIHALLMAKTARSVQLHHLQQVIVGGAVLSPGFRRSCIDDLGAKSVENWFGMTEGLLVRPGNQGDVSKVLHGSDVSIGWVMPGFSIRIADPDTDEPVPRNTNGELQGSCSIITRYIGGVGADSYYEDVHGRTWFKSGDQARMDSQGRIFITGRYKDMIIRGGVNMSPAAIEGALVKDRRLAALNPQVVGTLDDIAGEVPVAVVMGRASSEIREAMRLVVREHLGTEYVPAAVIPLHDLGVCDYPRTMAGKIQKSKLAQLVAAYRAGIEEGSGIPDDLGLSAVVKNIWAAAVGVDASRLPLDRPVGEFADSITIMRIRDTIRKKTGKTLPMGDMISTDTIAGQIELLHGQPSAPSQEARRRPVRKGPPTVDDMVHLIGNPDLMDPTKELATEAIAPYGLDWNDVEDVVPASDYFSVLAQTRIIDSWTFRFGIVAKKADKAGLRRALEAMLANNRILASFLVWDEERLASDVSLHVAVRQDKKVFDLVIHDGGTLKTVDSLKTLVTNYPHPDHAVLPGPLTRAMVYHIEETDTAAVILSVNHAVMDASSAQIFREDLDSALGGAAPLDEHVDFKPYAESYYTLRTSMEATAAAKWHINRLQGLENHKKAIYEPFPVPKSVYQASRAAGQREPVLHTFELPGLDHLRKEHRHITATALLKTAHALLEVHRTGHTHALFQNFEAARTTFPFLPRSFESLGEFGASDVAGPTLQSVINLMEVDPDETVLSLLDRVQAEQIALTRYATAPFRQIMRGLGAAGDMLPWIVGHQAFNWVPAMGGVVNNQYRNMDMVGFYANPSAGIGVLAGMGGGGSNRVFLQVFGQVESSEKLRELLICMERIAVWLTERSHWGCPVGGFTTVLQD